MLTVIIKILLEPENYFNLHMTIIMTWMKSRRMRVSFNFTMDAVKEEEKKQIL